MKATVVGIHYRGSPIKHALLLEEITASGKRRPPRNDGGFEGGRRAGDVVPRLSPRNSFGDK